MFDVSFIVRLVDQFTEPAGKIYKGAEKLAKITHDFGKGFNDSLQQLDTKKLDAAIAAADSRVSKARSALLGAAGMAVTLAAPIRSAMQFEKSFASVAKNLDVSDERLRQLRGNALKISGELGIAFSSINDIMEQAASAGTPEAQLEAFTAFTAKASIAFDMMAADVGENFAYIRNLYKENQKGLEDFSDAVNHLSNNMATRAADVVNFAVRGQGAADILHLNAVQMAALGAAMKSAGIAPEVAARGVSALRNRLVKGSKGVKEAFKSIGMSYDGFMAALDKDAPKAIMELFETLGRRPEGAEALLELVGQDFSDDFSKLASNPELLSEAFGLVANKAERAGSTVREFNTQINVGLGKWDRSIAKLTAFSIGLGNILQPAFNDTIDAMSGFVDQMNVFAQAHPDLTSGMVKAAAGLLAFGVASRVIGFVLASAHRSLLGLVKLFWYFDAAKGKNVALLARAFGLLMGPMRGVSRLVAGILRGLGRLAAFVLPRLVWSNFITRIPWAALAGRLSWGLLIPALKWGSRLIPVIGWATLAGTLAWDMLIKPLGWDKYLNLGYLKSLLDKAKGWIKETFGTGSDRSADPDYELTPRGFRKRTPESQGETPAPSTGRGRRPARYRGGGRDQLPEDVETKIHAEVIDKRPPQVTVNASISISGVVDPKAAASAAVSQLKSQMARANNGALHGGTE